MTLFTERAVPILPMAQFPPSGLPMGPQAFVLKMTPEALELLAAQLAAQQQPTPGSRSTASSQSTKIANGRAGAEIQKNHEDPLMQLVIGEAGQSQFVIGGSTFKVDAVNEPSTCEIYARHQSPASDSEQGSQSSSSTSSGLQMVAKVEGRLSVKRDYTTKIQQTVSERTARMNKEAQPRSTIILDATGGKQGVNQLHTSQRSQQGHSTTVPKPSSPAPASVITRPIDPKIQVFTPPKSDGSPSSSTSGPRGPKHRIPDSFASLDLNIPARWDHSIPLPIRLVHLIALKSRSETEVLAALVSDVDRKEALRILSILSEKKDDGVLHLRDEGYYYVRPYCWVDYSLFQRADAAKFMRIALRNLGYDDQDEEWSYLRKPNIWVDPWRDTPDGIRYYHEKEQKKANSLKKAQEDHDKLKAEALANPARMMTSSFKPGFVSPNPATVKGKKAVKEREPKPKKEKANTSTKTGIEKEPGAPPKSAHSATGSQSSNPAVANHPVEPSSLDAEIRVRQSGPGSTSGKLAVARRLQREKEEGRTSSTSTPSRSPLLLPSSSAAGTNARKRKSPEDEQDGFVKKRKPTDTDSVVSQRSSGESPSIAPVSKKRKGEDIDALSPPLKMRKGDSASTPRADQQPPVASTSSAHAIDAKTAARHRIQKPLSNDHTGRSREGRVHQWDYTTSSDDERAGSSPSALKLSKASVHRIIAPGKLSSEHHRSRSSDHRRDLLTPHRVAPPTSYMGFKAIFMQKWGEYGILNGIIMGEEAKLEKLKAGDDSGHLMDIKELKQLLKRRGSLEVELKELKAEILRLVAKPAS